MPNDAQRVAMVCFLSLLPQDMLRRNKLRDGAALIIAALSRRRRGIPLTAKPSRTRFDSAMNVNAACEAVWQGIE